MKFLVAALCVLQDPIDAELRKLAGDDLEERAKAEEAILKRGAKAVPALEAAIAKTTDTDFRGRAEALVRQLRVREKATALRPHVELVGDEGVWVGHGGFGLAGEAGVGAELAPKVFQLEQPSFVLVMWDDDGSRAEVQIFTPWLHLKIRQALFVTPAGQEYSSTIQEPDSFGGLKGGTADALLRTWPQWEYMVPDLAQQRGVFVCPPKRVDTTLLAAMRSARAELRRAAALAIRMLKSTAAIDAALRVLSDEDPLVRTFAASTIRWLTGATVPDDALNAWWKENANDAAAILKKQQSIRNDTSGMKLWQIPVDPRSPEAARDLARYMKHSSARARRDAALLAEEYKFGGLAAELVKLAEDREEKVRYAALRALVAVRAEGCADAYRKAASDRNVSVRRTAILGLRQNRDAQSLRAAFEKDLDEQVRHLAAIALVLVDGDLEAAKVLVDKVIDGPRPFCLDALYALNRMTNAATFDRIDKCSYGATTLNARWREAVEVFEKGAGLTLVVDGAEERLPLLQGSSGGAWRLRPGLPGRLLDHIEDISDKPGWTFVIDAKALTVTRIPDAIQHWKKWRAGQ